MSPIGRVFIVLNLVLAGTFVGFAGTYLRQQHNWKQEHGKVVKEFDAFKKDSEQRVKGLEDNLRTTENQKTKAEQDLGSTKGDLDKSNDENKRLTQQLAKIEGDVSAIKGVNDSIGTEVKTLFAQAQSAFKSATEAQAAKDEAVRAKDTADAALRDANGKITALEEAGKSKDDQLATLGKDNSELKMLVDVAEKKGFIKLMAQPQLGGRVTHVSGNICSISLTENPENAQIKPGFRFAIYDKESYKGEARVTDFDLQRNIVFCTIELKKGDILIGDAASTRTGN
jgi:hypothetical protein